MRVASIVLVLLTRAVSADTVLPDRETELQANQVRVFARLGQCERALEAGKEVAERDAAYYRELVATDAGMFACHYELETGQRYRSWRDRQPASKAHRFGVDGMVSYGPVVTLGGSLRYERESGLVLRLGYLRAQVIESEDNGADVGLAQIGYRRYAGGFYVHAEIGGAAIRFREHPDPFDDVRHPAEWRALPSASVGLGGKLGRTDVGLSLAFPAVGIGAHLGFDFARL
ncbi:MAG TPA: hypothetical protein VIU61_23555 [Kofleriaceae bacterium]